MKSHLTKLKNHVFTVEQETGDDVQNYKNLTTRTKPKRGRKRKQSPRSKSIEIEKLKE